MAKNKRRAPKGQHFGEPNYFQSADYNEKTRLMYQNWIIELAINRFRWVGLPETCDERALEWALLNSGQATICKPSNEHLLPMWVSLPAVFDGEMNMYGNPTAWRAVGLNGDTNFRSDWNNGAFIRYSKSRINPWIAIQLFATRLTHITRTEDINLFNQHTPMVIVAPDEMSLDATNLFKNISGYEPAVIVTKTFDNIDIKAISTEVPYIGLDLNVAKQQIFNDLFSFLGIEHLAFEKGERMIEEEARGNSYPTSLMLLNCLSERRKAADYLNKVFGFDIHVYFNNDVESYNFNFLSDYERMANAGLIGAGGGSVDGDNDGVADEQLQNEGREYEHGEDE